jgi:predicted SnoaL-like aldol condensation-catalyzing enzyme
MEKTKKEKAINFFKTIESPPPAWAGVVHPVKFKHHTLALEDGLAGLSHSLAQLPPHSVKVNPVRVFQDGEFVFAHSEYHLEATKIGFDILRFEENQIVEHWNNFQNMAGPNPSGRTMIDGERQVDNFNKSRENKNLVKSFVEDLLVNGRIDKLRGYFQGEDYLQHNPHVPDQVEGLENAAKEWAKQGSSTKYDTIHLVLGEGNFVLVVSEGHLKGQHTSFYGLFQVEKDKIAEHLDVLEAILPKEYWINQNGKFGFSHPN